MGREGERRKEREKAGKRERKKDFSPSLRKACPTTHAFKMSVLPEGSAGIPGEEGGSGPAEMRGRSGGPRGARPGAEPPGGGGSARLRNR